MNPGSLGPLYLFAITSLIILHRSKVDLQPSFFALAIWIWTAGKQLSIVL